VRRGGIATLLALGLVALGCGSRGTSGPPPPPPKRFPAPIFDGLSLGMTRAEVGRAHPIRPALTSAGRSRRVWIYSRPGEYTVELTFPENRDDARLARIDVHFGRSDATPEQYIGRFEARLGSPDVRRSKARINAYGDARHDQYDTVWSDATQYVFLTERVPAAGRAGAPVYFLTVKRKETMAKGPPTGYVPPPPPKGKDGKPIEEPIF
jgi:hypothetical protein